MFLTMGRAIQIKQITQFKESDNNWVNIAQKNLIVKCENSVNYTLIAVDVNSCLRYQLIVKTREFLDISIILIPK